jgi:hypothetical protein
MFHIQASNGMNTVTMHVRGIAELNEAYTMLRASACLEDAAFSVTASDGRTIYDRNFRLGIPDWWIGEGDDPGGYVKLVARPVRNGA